MTMIYQHLFWLLNATWQATIVILLVLLSQWALGTRLNPRWRYALWLLVLVRLVMPVTPITSSLSLFNFLHLQNISTAIQRRAPFLAIPFNGPETPPGKPSVDASSPLAPDESEEPAPSKITTHAWNNPTVLLLVWSAGALCLGLTLAISHYKIWRRVTPCRPLTDPAVLNLLEDCKQLMRIRVPISVVETSAVGSPSLFGFLRPRLLLPAGLRQQFNPEELRYVFLHELSHIKRLDILASWLMTVLQILHWFNPLVWLAFHRMRADRELACDALALSYAKDEENQPYGRTIIKLLEGFGSSAWAPSVAGTVENYHQLKERIRMIAKFKKTNRGLGLALCLFGGLALATLSLFIASSPKADADNGQRGNPFGPSAAADQVPPQIVSTSPAVGATDVDPAITEITVTFDQDMNQGGYSWTGGGPEYPTVPQGAKARWRDARTCVLPVKLEAAHFYRVGINSISYQNFRSASGLPVGPSAIYFTTQGASEELKMKTRKPEIVSITPANGAQDVSPSVTELRVNFNIPMGGGFSWTGGGPNFPKIPEGKKPFWTEDHKTCVLPVELQPNWTYRLGLNSPSFHNFQSAGGVQLDPVSYTFTTGAK